MSKRLNVLEAIITTIETATIEATTELDILKDTEAAVDAWVAQLPAMQQTRIRALTSEAVGRQGYAYVRQGSKTWLMLQRAVAQNLMEHQVNHPSSLN